jgi:integrase/predicted RNA-binding Zn-ribbon protein involved in translation (DUF1610 family)
LETLTIIVCPSCGSDKRFKDGVRKLTNGAETQRYLCRKCGFRYSSTYYASLNTVNDNLAPNQICAKKAKNLDPTTEIKTVVGDERLNPDTKGLLAQFYLYLEKEAYCETIGYPNLIKYLATKGADLHDPESVKTVIARMTRVNKQGETVKVKNGTKMLYCAAYDVFCKMLGIQWQKPSYRQEEKEVYVPFESELDALINGAKSRRMATYLQTLKETFADPSEALRIRWIDIDSKNSTIKIDFPVKNHNTGTMQVSNKLISMLSALPHTKERVFPYTYKVISESFRKLRKQVAAIQQEPRILAVELRGFRHWGGTMLSFNTNGNVLEVKRLLRHKAIASTMKYIGQIVFKTDEFETTSATTLEEILKLGSDGWLEYSVVKMNGIEVHCFKKPKRFSSHA